MLELTIRSDGIFLRLKVVPGSSRDRIVGELAGALKVTVAAPPERGKANKAVTRLVAEALGLRPHQVEVIGGIGSPNKTIRIVGADEKTVRSLAERD